MILKHRMPLVDVMRFNDLGQVWRGKIEETANIWDERQFIYSV